MAQVDYYQVLGISPTTTQDEIRKAYRRLARRFHPDTNPAWEDDVKANRQMILLNEAYAVLRDPTRRAEYDRQRQQRAEQQAQQARRYEQAQARTQSYTYTRTYTQGGTKTHRADVPPAEPPEGWPELVFRPSSLGVAIGGILLVGIAIGFVSLALSPFSASMMAMAAVSFMAGALMALAALPYFQGYIVLARDRLVEYPVFGLWAPREIQYAQICDVYERTVRTRSGTHRYVVVDYFKADAQGKWDVTRYYSKRLMGMGNTQEHRELLRALRVRAKAVKLPSSQPSLGTFIMGMWELMGLWVLLLMLGIIIAFQSLSKR